MPFWKAWQCRFGMPGKRDAGHPLGAVRRAAGRDPRNQPVAADLDADVVRPARRQQGFFE